MITSFYFTVTSGPLFRFNDIIISLGFNYHRIEKCKLWNVVREVTNPKKSNEWTLNTETGPTSDEATIANTLHASHNYLFF